MSCSELIEMQHTNIRQPFSTWYCNNFKPMAGCPCWYRACRTLCTQSLWKGTCLDDSSSSLPLSLRQLRAKNSKASWASRKGKALGCSELKESSVCICLFVQVCAVKLRPKDSIGSALQRVSSSIVSKFSSPRIISLARQRLWNKRDQKSQTYPKNFKNPRFNALGSLCYRLLPKGFTKGIQGLKSSSAQDPCTFGFLAQNGLWMVPQTHHGTAYGSR